MENMWLYDHNLRIYRVSLWYEWKTSSKKTDERRRDDNSQPRPNTGLDTSGEIETDHFPPPTSKFTGQMIRITLSFPNKSNHLTDTCHQKAKGIIQIFLCSIYHPQEIYEQKGFYDELDQFITNRPRNFDIHMAEYINCNVGVTSKLSSDTLGTHGIDNRNIKGR